MKRPTEKRAQNKEAIRKRIVKSALTLFQTKGFNTTTAKAIARQAGIAESTLFNYFKTKEDRVSLNLKRLWEIFVGTIFIDSGLAQL